MRIDRKLKLLSRKAPYHQYTEVTDIRSALAREEILKRPASPDDDVDEIPDQFWTLILDCCTPTPEDRLECSKILELLTEMQIRDNRPGPNVLPGTEVLKLRPRPAIDIDLVEEFLEEIQVGRHAVIQDHTKMHPPY
jgi:hypothetical protein